MYALVVLVTASLKMGDCLGSEKFTNEQSQV